MKEAELIVANSIQRRIAQAKSDKGFLLSLKNAYLDNGKVTIKVNDLPFYFLSQQFLGEIVDQTEKYLVAIEKEIAEAEQELLNFKIE